MKHRPSKYQQAFLDWVVVGEGNAVLVACAGSGKTTTIRMALQAIDDQGTAGRTLLTSFGRAICQELRRGAPPWAQVRTLNSLGAAAVRRWMAATMRATRLYENKLSDLCVELMDPDERHLYGARVRRLTRLAKAHAMCPHGWELAPRMVPESQERWQALITEHGMADASAEIPILAGFASGLLHESLGDLNLHDFDDQLYWPVLFDLPLPTFDWIFVDEAQDISPIQRAMLHRMMHSNSRLVAVGDPRQAIFGFRGGDHVSILRIIEEFDAVQLPLSISYRCAKAIVAEANRVMDGIEAAQDAAEGWVEDAEGPWPAWDFRATDLVVCRLNAPLVKLAYSIISQGCPVHLLGRDIGKGLIKLIESFDCTTIGALISRLQYWLTYQMEAATDTNQPTKAVTAQDKHDSIMAFIECTKADDPEGLCAEIERIYAGGKGVTLATVHKAKGLEADRVFILDRWLMPSKYAVTPKQIQQEKNIEYVAITRAKRTLIYIDSERTDDENAQPQ